MMNQITNDEIDAVLVDFAEAHHAGKTGTMLAEWSARYPALVRDFGRIAEENWAGRANEAVPAQMSAEVAEARFREIGRAALRAKRPATTQRETAPLTNLLHAAQERGLTRQTFAARLQLPDTLVLKLHRRLISAASIPARLVEQIAETVGRTTDEITDYLKQPAQMPLAASFRSDSAPQPQTETFADALQSDPDATPAHKAEWFNGDGSTG